MIKDIDKSNSTRLFFFFQAIFLCIKKSSILWNLYEYFGMSMDEILKFRRLVFIFH